MLLRISLLLALPQHCSRPDSTMDNRVPATSDCALSRRQDKLPFNSSVLSSVRFVIGSDQASLADSAYAFEGAAKHAPEQSNLPKGWRVSETI